MGNANSSDSGSGSRQSDHKVPAEGGTAVGKEAVMQADPTAKDKLGGTNLMGAPGVAFSVIATVGPLAAMTGGCLFVMRMMGNASSGTYLLAGLIALLFSFGFMALARKCSSAGGFASFIALSFGNRIGTAVAFITILAYNATLIAIYVSGALYAVQLIEFACGIAIPWQAFAFFMVAVSICTGFFEINTSIKVIGTLMILSIIVLLVMCFAIVGAPHPNGFTFDGFAPSNIFTASLPIAVMFAFNCFGGYEASIVYSEETRNPKKNIPRAVYFVVFFLTTLYCFITWALANGVDGSLSEAVDSSTTEFVVMIMDQYAGYGWSVAMQILIVISVMLAGISFHNVTSRYLFALGRGGALPAVLGKAHPKQKSPYIANFIQGGLTVLILLFCIVSGAEGFNMIFGLSLGLGALITLIMMALCSLSTIVFFVRNNDAKENAWTKYIAPALSAIVMAALAILSIVNFDTITEGYGALWVIIPVFFVIGLVVTFFKAPDSIHLEADYSGDIVPEGDVEKGETFV